MTRLDFTMEVGGFSAKVEGYLVDSTVSNAPRSPLPAVLICPGGGYGFVSDREAEPIALQWAAAGVHAFVLHYSVAPQVRFPIALQQAAKAMAMIRSHAAEWNVNSQKIAVMGFSAGGHLAATLSTLWDSSWVKEVLAPEENARPDASILCYAVISGGEFAHVGSFQNLLGEKMREGIPEALSAEKQVKADTPPAFLWHTVQDPVVPVENSMLYAAALRRQGIPFEMHLYERGAHGLSLCTPWVGADEPDCVGWFALANGFLQRLG